MKVFKYPIIAVGTFNLSAPAGAEFLCVQTQRDEVFVWAKVDPERPKIAHALKLRATGDEFDGTEGRYIGTFQFSGGALVFHLFEEKEADNA